MDAAALLGVNVAHMRQSRTDSVLECKAKVLNSFPFRLAAVPGRWGAKEVELRKRG